MSVVLAFTHLLEVLYDKKMYVLNNHKMLKNVYIILKSNTDIYKPYTSFHKGNNCYSYY